MKETPLIKSLRAAVEDAHLAGEVVEGESGPYIMYAEEDRRAWEALIEKWAEDHYDDQVRYWAQRVVGSWVDRSQRDLIQKIDKCFIAWDLGCRAVEALDGPVVDFMGERDQALLVIRKWAKAHVDDEIREWATKLLEDRAQGYRKDEAHELDAEDTPGYKLDKGKPKMELLPPEVLEGIARVFTHGAQKYGISDNANENNWIAGMRWGRMYGALQRHLSSWWAGEELDEDSGEHHLYHAGCCLMMLAEYANAPRYAEYDDRYKRWDE